ncbi:unnamed protein product [Pseudo-nitzschia multistriata]|uniref:Helicase-associated domain-containing protein n=1 Tax=Pseudo-nitzschia multistriata TaxID=183589 RepID=A0A448YY91_9STRA|nr:unnamed protein product [Pseudo-nitzschia multistriata]
MDRGLSRTSNSVTNQEQTSDSDVNGQRKIHGFVPSPSTSAIRSGVALNNFDEERNKLLTASITFDDPLAFAEARAFVGKGQQTLDFANTNAALIRARQLIDEEKLQRTLLRNRLYLEDARKNSALESDLASTSNEEKLQRTLLRYRLYLEDARKNSALESDLASTSAVASASLRIGDHPPVGGSSRKRTLDQDSMLMLERERILRRARQEEQLIAEILASERRKRDGDMIFNLLSQQNPMASGTSRSTHVATHSDDLSRMTLYNRDSLSLQSALQSSNLPAPLTDTASTSSILGKRTSFATSASPSMARRLSTMNRLPCEGNGLGDAITQRSQAPTSLCDPIGSRDVNSVYASMLRSVAPLPTTAPSPVDFIRSSTLHTAEAPSFAGVSLHQQAPDEADDISKRFNKHQCKQWTVKFHELIAYKKKHGHCNVPHLYKENRGLAMWVKRQRHQHNLLAEKKPSTLTGERIKLLESIGFIWNCLDSAWEKNFQDLRAFAICHGHFSVPHTYEKNTKLSSWVVNQRRQCKLVEDGKPSSMTKHRFEKLEQIGFPVVNKKRKRARSTL